MKKKLLAALLFLLRLPCFSQPIDVTLNQGGAVERPANAAISWQKFSSSMNAFGVTEISSKLLQYNDELNAVSFIQRKSVTYTSSPAINSPTSASSGIIVAMVSTNQGISWDSTNVWSNQTQWARFPQGGLYNPSGNTNLANAHVIAMGPITYSSGYWTGSYIASKPLSAPGNTLGFNNIASTVPGAQQYFPNTGTFSPNPGKFDFPSLSFCTTDDGAVRTLALAVGNFNGFSDYAKNYRGVKVLKGAFTSGIFNWTGDSINIKSLVNNNSFYAEPQVIVEPHMAWNESGTVGYVVHFGSRAGSVGVNKGIQPIVHKTTDGGNTWTLLPGIDFSSSQAFQLKVLNKLATIKTNSNLAIPFFNTNEGIDCVVDSENHLHIVGSILSSYSDHTDSLLFTQLFNHSDGETYHYRHSPGMRPYIYDFMETNNGWNVEIVDSMLTEAPGVLTSQPGYSYNPWDSQGGSNDWHLNLVNIQNQKISSAARIQASRTPDGKYIVYTWAESDTTLTAQHTKWNSKPDIKARAFDVTNKKMCDNKINLTPMSSSILVSGKAQLHHTSPRCILVSKNGNSVDVNVPITITTNQNTPLTQQSSNDHFFTCSTLTFVFSVTGVTEHTIKSADLNLFPNPAKNRVTVRFNSNNTANVTIELIDLMGKTIRKTDRNIVKGINQTDLDLSDFEKGIYFVKVSLDTHSVTTKLIIE